MTEVLAPAESPNLPEVKEVPFVYGTTDYETFGQKNPERNPYILIPGFSGNFVAEEQLARELSDGGQEQVIITGQPKFKREGLARLPNIIDLHAEAVLAIIEDNGWQNEPLDVVIHSMGMQIFVRAAEMAKERGFSCFNRHEGSHSYAISPAGLVPKENLAKLGLRWGNFVLHDLEFAEKFDADKEIRKATGEAISKRPSKSVREVANLVKDKVDFNKLGEIGIKPFVLVMGEDRMFPYSGRIGQVGTTIEKQLGLDNPDGAGNLSGAASPVDALYPENIDVFTATLAKEHPELDEEEVGALAEDSWKKDKMDLDRNSRSGHADVNHHPRRIASAIKQIRDLEYNQDRLHS